MLKSIFQNASSSEEIFTEAILVEDIFGNIFCLFLQLCPKIEKLNFSDRSQSQK